MISHPYFRRSAVGVARLLLTAGRAGAATFNIADGDVTGLKNAIITANAITPLTMDRRTVCQGEMAVSSD